MISASATAPARSTEWGRGTSARLVRTVVVFTAVLLLLTSAWLLVRRFGGAFHASLAAPTLLLLVGWFGSLVFVSWAFVLTGVGQAFFPSRPHPQSTDRVAEASLRQGPAAEPEEDLEAEEPLLPEHVLQRVVRARDERGSEVVFGTVRCDFVAGQRQQSIHLAFCPPLPTIAQFTTDQVAGPAVRIKPVMVETFGVGFEAKLASPSKGPVQVQIQFFAFEKPADGADD